MSRPLRETVVSLPKWTRSSQCPRWTGSKNRRSRPAGGQYDDGHQSGGIHVRVLGVVHNVGACHGVVAALTTLTFQSVNSETFETTTQY